MANFTMPIVYNNLHGIKKLIILIFSNNKNLKGERLISRCCNNSGEVKPIYYKN